MPRITHRQQLRHLQVRGRYKTSEGKGGSIGVGIPSNVAQLPCRYIKSDDCDDASTYARYVVYCKAFSKFFLSGVLTS